MFDFLGRMFGNSKAGEKIIDGAVSGIDKIWYTDEEKAIDAAETHKRVLAAKEKATDAYMEWVRSTSGSRIARRMLAIIAAGMWAIQKAGEQVFRMAAIWKEDPVVVEKLVASAESLNAGASSTAELVAVVFAFYFGGPAAVEISKNALAAFAAKGKGNNG